VALQVSERKKKREEKTRENGRVANERKKDSSDAAF